MRSRGCGRREYDDNTVSRLQYRDLLSRGSERERESAERHAGHGVCTRGVWNLSGPVALGAAIAGAVAVLSARMVAKEAKASFAEWLGAEFAGKTLTVSVQSTLAAGFAAEIIQEADVHDDHSLDEAQLKEALELWKNMFTDSVKEVSGRLRDSDITRVKQWLAARFLEFDVSKEDVTAKISKAAQSDMTDQGASELWQLGYVELALALSRRPSRAECKNYDHRSSWKTMDGGKLSVKQAGRSLDMVLEDARKSGSTMELEDHFSQTATTLMEDPEDDFATLSGSRVLMMWQDVRRAIKTQGGIIYYLIRSRRVHAGRGLPTFAGGKLVDPVLVNESLAAQIEELAGHPKQFDGGGLPLSTMSITSGSTTSHSSGSSVGSSASMASEKMSSQMSELLSAVKASSDSFASVKTALGDVKSTLGTLTSRVQAIERSTGDGNEQGGGRCFKCGQSGHRAADCPNKGGKQKDKESES